MQEYYTYLYLDPTKPCKLELTDVCLLFEPFYVGKGTGDRIDEHMQKSKRVYNHAFKNRVSKLKRMQEGWPYRMKVETFHSSDEAYRAEDALILEIGSNYIAEAQDGPLTNLTIGAKPRSQKGRSYVEIYGSEEAAKAQIEKRRAIQIARGGYAKGMKHSEETKKRLAESSQRNQANGGYMKGKKQSATFRENARLVASRIARNRSLQFLKDTRSGETYVVFAYKAFCRERGLKTITLDKNFSMKRGAAKSGCCEGWMMLRKEPIPESLVKYVEAALIAGDTHFTNAYYVQISGNSE